jgi:uncharacterized protein YbjT (DUF2867 family)
MTTAIVVGATGLVGGQLVQQLLDDPRFESVVVLTRRPTGRTHPKLAEQLVDFGQPATWSPLVHGDVAFSALGTTRGQAGSVQAQRVVDYDYQFAVAKAAKQNGVPTFVLVSSASADPASPFAYMKMKGELERDVAALQFPKLYVLQPGPLHGTREKPRFIETLSIGALTAITRLGLLRDLRPIAAAQVASAMLTLAVEQGPSRTVGPAACFEPSAAR